MPKRQRKEMRGCSNAAAANSESHVPCFQERVDTGTYVLSGCRGVSGLVPQPLCMKFKSAEADWNRSFVSQHAEGRNSRCGLTRKLYRLGGMGWVYWTGKD